jgi:putative ABC transport system ATP-binding protein
VAPPLIGVQHLTKVYDMGTVQVHALRDVTLSVAVGEMVAIMGPSGSGKSTLMNIIGCLDRPSSGSYFLAGEDVSRFSDDRLAEVRNHKIGFVFQTFNLLPRMSALQNALLPLIYAGAGPSERKQRARHALQMVGLADRMSHAPNELSGGQKQRVAIARALVSEPDLILADEPTGNLDSASGNEIMNILQTLNRDQGMTIVVVTHDADIAHRTSRIVHLYDGLVSGEEVVSPSTAPPSSASL